MMGGGIRAVRRRRGFLEPTAPGGPAVGSASGLRGHPSGGRCWRRGAPGPVASEREPGARGNSPLPTAALS